MSDLTSTKMPAAIAAQMAAVEIATVSPLPVSVEVAKAGRSLPAMRVPQMTQNFAPGWSVAPHCAQVPMSSG